MIGYVYKNQPDRDRWVTVYLSRQELRLMCGEVKDKEIGEVIVLPSVDLKKLKKKVKK